MQSSFSLLKREYHSWAKCTVIGNNLSMWSWNDAKENIKCFTNSMLT